MRTNQPHWPREWLMTDERLGIRLWEAIDALPAGAGVVFRHYSLDSEHRAELGRRVAEGCRQRDLLLAVAGDVALSKSLGAQLVHNPTRDQDGLPFSRSVHSLSAAESAWKSGASLIFLSPLFPTRSHPGARTLKPEVANAIAVASEAPVIALGGVTRERFAELESEGFYGWAGIDAWLTGPAGPGGSG
jgi:thiamine-phosphate pyrophosphorylase